MIVLERVDVMTIALPWKLSATAAATATRESRVARCSAVDLGLRPGLQSPVPRYAHDVATAALEVLLHRFDRRARSGADPVDHDHCVTDQVLMIVLVEPVQGECRCPPAVETGTKHKHQLVGFRDEALVGAVEDSGTRVQEEQVVEPVQQLDEPMVVLAMKGHPDRGVVVRGEYLRAVSVGAWIEY